MTYWFGAAVAYVVMLLMAVTYEYTNEPGLVDNLLRIIISLAILQGGYLVARKLDGP